jgi:hypothetical protein
MTAPAGSAFKRAESEQRRVHEQSNFEFLRLARRLVLPTVWGRRGVGLSTLFNHVKLYEKLCSGVPKARKPGPGVIAFAQGYPRLANPGQG